MTWDSYLAIGDLGADWGRDRTTIASLRPCRFPIPEAWWCRKPPLKDRMNQL
jgi:hypothetical protein